MSSLLAGILHWISNWTTQYPIRRIPLRVFSFSEARIRTSCTLRHGNSRLLTWGDVDVEGYLTSEHFSTALNELPAPLIFNRLTSWLLSRIDLLACDRGCCFYFKGLGVRISFSIFLGSNIINAISLIKWDGYKNPSNNKAPLYINKHDVLSWSYY